jgi:hypothetical protein
MSADPDYAGLGPICPQFARLNEEVDASIGPFLLAGTFGHQPLSAHGRFQSAQNLIESLDIPFTMRLLQLPRKPLQLATNTEPLHWHINMTAIFRHTRNKGFSISFPGEDRDAIVWT